MLALLADARRDPPHGRVKEQQRLGNGLSDVDRVIPPADMGQLVSDQRLDLMRRQAGQSRDRQEDDRAHRADHARRVDERGFDDAKADVEAKLSRQTLTRRLPRRQRLFERGKTQPAYSERRASESRQEKHDAAQPRPHDDREPALDR